MFLRHLSAKNIYLSLALSLLVAVNGNAAGYPQADFRSIAGPKGIEHVFIVVLENTDAADALAQPFLAGLAQRGAYLNKFYAQSHPSLPNYLALTSGSTQGVNTDDNVDLDVRHIGDLLEEKVKSWKSYTEDLPSGCDPTKHKKGYYRKHQPFMSYINVSQKRARCLAHIVPATQLDIDVQKGQLPNYALYVPNIDNDGHDTGVGEADTWLKQRFGRLLANPQFTRGTLFVVTFDEGDRLSLGEDNLIYTVLYGDMVRPGAQVEDQLSHYSLLRLVEDIFSLGSLGQGDQTAPQIAGIWR